MRFVEVPEIEVGEFYNKKISLCTAETKRPLRFQIPRMYMPFGVSAFVPEVGDPKYNIDFSMKGWNEENGYVWKFYNFVKSLENKIIDSVFEQRIEIFGSDLTREQITNMFNSNIKETIDRDPKFRVKVDNHTRFFDVNDVELTNGLEGGLYSKNSGVAMVEVGGVYFLNRMFGIIWKVNQLKVYEPQRLKGFHFQLDDD